MLNTSSSGDKLDRMWLWEQKIQIDYQARKNCLLYAAKTVLSPEECNRTWRVFDIHDHWRAYAVSIQIRQTHKCVDAGKLGLRRQSKLASQTDLHGTLSTHCIDDPMK
jgi:hypothetical protein